MAAKKYLLTVILLIFICSGIFLYYRVKPNTNTFAVWKNVYLEKIKSGYISTVAVNPQNDNVIYAVESRKINKSGFHYYIKDVWVSKDRGIHWIKSNKLKSEDVYLMKKNNSVYSGTCLFRYSENSNVLLKQASLYPSPLIERSDDNGKTWKKVFTGNLIFVSKSIQYCDDAKGNIYFSTNFGKTWRHSGLPPLSFIPSKNNISIEIDSKNPNIIYIGSPSGLFKSVEGKGPYEYYPIYNGINPSYLYVTKKKTATLFAVCKVHNSYATYFSINCGKIWKKYGDFYYNPVFENMALKVKSGKKESSKRKLYISENHGKSWQSFEIDLDGSGIHSVSLSNESTVYLETYRGLFRLNTDKRSIHNIIKSDETYWETTDGSSCFNDRLCRTYGSNRTIYWASELLESSDNGLSWHKMDFVHYKHLHGSVITCDPDNPIIVYLGITGTDDTEPLSDKEISKEGIYKSKDCGKTWIKIGLDGFRVSTVKISPKTGIIYAGTFNNGLFKSSDSGKTWERVKLDGDTHLSVSSLAIDPSNGIVYAGILGGGIFKTKDEK